MHLFSENALLFLPPDQLPKIAEKLKDDAIRRQIRENKVALSSPTAAIAEGLLLRDPLGLMPLFVDRLLAHRGALKVDLSDGYYLSEDNRTLIMLVKPTHPSQDLAFSRKLLAAAREDAEAVRAALAADDAGGETTTLRFGGNPAALTEESALLEANRGHQRRSCRSSPSCSCTGSATGASPRCSTRRCRCCSGRR